MMKAVVWLNKAQKAVQQSQLNDEKHTLKLLERVYDQARQDCENKIRQLSSRTDLENLQSIIYQKQYQEALKKQLEGILDNLQSEEFTSIADYLQKSYHNGYVGVMYDLHKQNIPIIMPINQNQVIKALQTDSKLSKGLYARLGEDVNYLKRSIRAELSRGIANGSTWNEIAGKIAKGMNSPFNTSINNAIRIARTEGHRVQQRASLESMIAAKAKGADIVKQWDSTLDGETRPHHRMLDGQIREVEEYFEIDDLKALAPGHFGRAKEDCNCRCCMLQRARWALDEDELNELKERAAYFGLDKTKDFEEFKQKYLKLPKNADTIKINNKPIKYIATKTIGGLECLVEEVKSQDFPDGTGVGVKKTVPAIVYTTPDGTKFIYPKKYDKSKQSLTPEQAIDVWSKVPEYIRTKIQKEIYIVDYYNPQDSYWRKIYKNFTHSYATGGEDITLYRSSYHDMDYLLHTYCHEGGHYIDYTIDGTDKTNRYCQQQEWKDAMKKDFQTSGKKSYRAYGENSELEDFADSVGYYVTAHNEFVKLFPERTKLLDEILK